MKIENIKPYEKNAKIHTVKQLELLAKIVAEIGWRQSVEVNQEGVIVVGHGRYLAWQKFKDKYNLPGMRKENYRVKHIMQLPNQYQ